MRDTFTSTVDGAAGHARSLGVDARDEDRPSLADVEPGPPVECPRPCGWCTVERPCESMRRGVEASQARRAS